MWLDYYTRYVWGHPLLEWQGVGMEGGVVGLAVNETECTALPPVRPSRAAQQWLVCWRRAGALMWVRLAQINKC